MLEFFTTVAYVQSLNEAEWQWLSLSALSHDTTVESPNTARAKI
jgi:hypothetical protein